jgi:hypothetical protein
MAAAERSVNTKLRNENKWAAFQQLFAGVSAGIVTTICTHPLDLIKTRMQSNSEALKQDSNCQSIVMQLLKLVGLYVLLSKSTEMSDVYCLFIAGCRRT